MISKESAIGVVAVDLCDLLGFESIANVCCTNRSHLIILLVVGGLCYIIIGDTTKLHIKKSQLDLRKTRSKCLQQ